ncbi:MAG: hypothetical protein WBD64_08410 [Candidatus Zixiibacteriota bacterium]
MKTKISNRFREMTKSKVMAFWGSLIVGGIGGAILGFHANAVPGAICGLLLGSFFSLFYVYALLMNHDRRVRLLSFLVLIAVGIHFKFRFVKMPEIALFSWVISYGVWIYVGLMFAILSKMRSLWLEQRSVPTTHFRMKRFMDQFTKWFLTADIPIGSLPIFTRKTEQQIEPPEIETPENETPTLFRCPFCHRRSELDEFDYNRLTEVIQHSCGFTLDEGSLKKTIREEKMKGIREDFWSRGSN